MRQPHVLDLGYQPCSGSGPLVDGSLHGELAALRSN